MAENSVRINVTLPAEHALRLSRLAERTRVGEGALASSLLTRAIEEADRDLANVLALLDQVRGVWERIGAGIADGRAGRTAPLGDP